MKVLFDISMLGYGYLEPRERTGINRIVEHLALALPDAAECDVQYSSVQNFQGTVEYLLTNARMAQVRLPDPRNGLQAALDRSVVGLCFRIRDAKGLSKLCLRLNRKVIYTIRQQISRSSPVITPATLASAEIFHSTFNAIPDQVRKAKRLKRFLTVYDLIPIRFPGLFEGHLKPELFENIWRSLGQDDWAFCISRKTKDDFCNYRRMDPGRVFVTYPAADPELFHPCNDPEVIAQVRKRYGIPDSPYILTLGALQPHKNVDQVIRAFVHLIQEQRIPDLNLVIAGPKVRPFKRIFSTIAEYRVFQRRLVMTDYVADQDLAALYSGSLAFVFLSLYEGFGLPPLEAMQCGVPVITSNTSSLPEVVGDAGLMLDPTDVDGLSQDMLEIYRNASLRANMAAKSIERAKHFTWEEFTRRTILGYRTALESRES